MLLGFRRERECVVGSESRQLDVRSCKRIETATESV
jgi:hypothetical protein